MVLPRDTTQSSFPKEAVPKAGAAVAVVTAMAAGVARATELASISHRVSLFNRKKKTAGDVGGLANPHRMMVYVRRIGNIAVQYVPVRANICAVQPNLFACFSCMCDATVRVARCESTCGWSFRILENAKKSSRPGWDTFVASQRNSNSETLTKHELS